MNQKIKSIKLKESTKDLLNNKPPEGFTNTFQTVLDLYPEYFEIEYEKPTEQPKPKTKYRKNGSLVFAPGNNLTYYYPNIFSFEPMREIYSGGKSDFNLLQQGLVFDNKEACQLWADKLKIAYALKQRIVESESQDEYLDCCYIWFNGIKQYTYQLEGNEPDPKYLCVSTNAKDILMSDSVSVEEFKAFIEVFSL
jgi:hypothetical protein